MSGGAGVVEGFGEGELEVGEFHEGDHAGELGDFAAADGGEEAATAGVGEAGLAGEGEGGIEHAAGGTFFLDEVGELRLDLQARLLRVLQERTFERVGGNRTLDAEVRWVAATNCDLEAMVRDGSFREDLYHRLAAFPVRLPALRERPEDILPLAELLLREVCSELKRPPLTLSPRAKESLVAAPWPGNVRQLRNVLERLREEQHAEVAFLALKEHEASLRKLPHALAVLAHERRAETLRRGRIKCAGTGALSLL
jgi:DNA-binding NtrC family response regulator